MIRPGPESRLNGSQPASVVPNGGAQQSSADPDAERANSEDDAGKLSDRSPRHGVLAWRRSAPRRSKIRRRQGVVRVRRIRCGLAAALPAGFAEEPVHVSEERGEGPEVAATELPRAELARSRARCCRGGALRSARLQMRRNWAGSGVRQQHEHHSQPERHSQQETHGPRRSLAASSTCKPSKAFCPK